MFHEKIHSSLGSLSHPHTQFEPFFSHITSPLTKFSSIQSVCSIDLLSYPEFLVQVLNHIHLVTIGQLDVTSMPLESVDQNSKDKAVYNCNYIHLLIQLLPASSEDSTWQQSNSSYSLFTW